MRGLVFYGTTGKFTFRMLATVLAGQSVCLFLGALVARAVTASGASDSNGAAYLVVALWYAGGALRARRRFDASPVGGHLRLGHPGADPAQRPRRCDDVLRLADLPGPLGGCV